MCYDSTRNFEVAISNSVFKVTYKFLNMYIQFAQIDLVIFACSWQVRSADPPGLERVFLGRAGTWWSPPWLLSTSELGDPRANLFKTASRHVNTRPLSHWAQVMLTKNPTSTHSKPRNLIKNRMKSALTHHFWWWNPIKLRFLQIKYQ